MTEEIRTEEREKEVPKKKKKGVLLIVVALCLLVIVFVVVANRGGGSGETVVVDIPAGAGSAAIAEILHEADLIDHPLCFRMYTKLTGEPAFKKGRHMLNTAMSYGEMIAQLESNPSLELNTKKVSIPEGYELSEIIDLLVENGLGTKERFYDEVENGQFDYAFVAQIPKRENRLEGYLYPETYLFDISEGEHAILDRMLAEFEKQAVPLYEASGKERTLDEFVTMASVVEREAANDEERPYVASVFYNRIDIGMKLESCATVQYILKERKTVLSNADTAIESPYNTYRNIGLPIGPIASPGLASIEAAIYPAETDYLYFVATADGSQNLFSTSFEEHNQKTAQQYGN